jgi:cytidine deaminase
LQLSEIGTHRDVSVGCGTWQLGRVYHLADGVTRWRRQRIEDQTVEPAISQPDNRQPIDLIGRARSAAERAYAPYSRFRVGAAAIADGTVFEGCNIENASYGLTICAERVALFAAVAAGHRQIAQLAVSCIDASPELGVAGQMPCGACRQVMVELVGLDGEILVDGVGSFRVSDLLPSAFTL